MTEIKVAVLLTVFNRKEITLKGLRSLFVNILKMNQIHFDVYMTDDGISTSIKKEDWFVHAATDFLNFHKSTNSKDHAAYVEGMAIYVGSVGIPKWQLYRYP